MAKGSASTAATCSHYGHGPGQDYQQVSGQRYYQYQQRYHGGSHGYNNPYHESPIDLTKYYGDAVNGDTTDNSEMENSRYLWTNNSNNTVGQETVKVKIEDEEDENNTVLKNTPPVQRRRLATGCAANYEIFGHLLSKTY